MACLATYYRSLDFYQRYHGFISEASHRVYGPNIRRTHSQTLIVEGTKPVLRWPVARRSYIGPSSARFLFLSFFLIKLHSRSSYSSVVRVDIIRTRATTSNEGKKTRQRRAIYHSVRRGCTNTKSPVNLFTSNEVS